MVRTGAGPGTEQGQSGAGPANASDGQHLHAIALEAGQSVRGNPGIGNQCIDVRNLANQRRAGHRNLARIGQHNDLLGLPHHGAKHRCLVGLNRRRSAPHIHAAGPDERLIQKHAAQHLHRRRPGQRKSPRPAHVSSGERHIERHLVIELHANIHCVGDHVNPGPLPYAASRLGGRCPCGKSYRFVLADQLCRHPDAPLLFGKPSLAHLKGRIESERLVQHLPGQRISTVRATNQPSFFQPRQVAPRGKKRTSEHYVLYFEY